MMRWSRAEDWEDEDRPRIRKAVLGTPIKAPAHGSYAVQEVIPDNWGTIPKDLKPLYDELWMAMRPVREHRVQIDAAAFAAACQRAGLWPSWPTVPLTMDQLCMHWCRYAAMEQARLAPEGDAKS